MSEQSVGIVMRTRDRAMFLRRALASVAAQTHSDWQLVIVNDGGDPGPLAEVVAAAALPEGRLQVIGNAASRGRAAAFNQGLAALTTRFVACLDDDDTWDPGFLAALVAFHAQNAPLVPDLGGVAAQVTALREDLEPDAEGRMQIVPLGIDGLPNAFGRTDFLFNPIAYATYRQDLYPVQWLLERAAVAAVGGFPEAFEVMEDRAFMMRFLEHRRIALLDRPLAFHHRRIRRGADTGRSAALNTLDNPSYDWRRFADLAQHTTTTPDGAPEAALAGLIRAVGAAAVRELNAETSALWHKIDGEAAGLRARIAALEARLSADAPPAPAPDAACALWSLWAAVGDHAIGWPLGVGVAFLGRLSISHTGPDEGLLVHAAPDRREAVVQVPQTGSWCALELDLAGLAAPGRGLRVDLMAALPGGGLFQTGVARRLPSGKFELAAAHVHAAGDAAAVVVTRCLASDLLRPEARPKFSIVLPRQARNLRLHLHHLSVAPE